MMPENAILPNQNFYCQTSLRNAKNELFCMWKCRLATVCRSLSAWYCATSQTDGCTVYALDEKKFMFANVLIGSRVKARFKLRNSSKVKLHALRKAHIPLRRLSPKLSHKVVVMHFEILDQRRRRALKVYKRAGPTLQFCGNRHSKFSV